MRALLFLTISAGQSEGDACGLAARDTGRRAIVIKVTAVCAVCKLAAEQMTWLEGV